MRYLSIRLLLDSSVNTHGWRLDIRLTA